MAELAKTFGLRVRALRMERGFSQGDLADAAGLSEEWIRRLERGVSSPSFATLEALASALHVTAAELFAPHPETPESRFADAIAGLEASDLAWLLAGARRLRRTP